MITVSDNAVDKITELMKEEKQPNNAFLRVKVKRGGCSGFSYKLDFDTSINDGDKQFDKGAVKVVIDNKSILYILGMTLNYEGGLNGAGFIFSNPNASKTCGCGSSFAV